MAAETPRPASQAPLAEAYEARGAAECAGGEAALGESLLEVEEPSPEMLAAVAGQSLASRREQLELQTAQLAAHLRERLRDVDRREAALHASVAQLECDLRASRLWLREREMEFQSRENELLRQIEELREQAQSPPPQEAQDGGRNLDAARAELDEREQQLRLREDELRERRFELDRQAAALSHAQQLWHQQREREERQLVEERQQYEQAAALRQDELRREFAEQVRRREEELRAAEELVRQQAQALDRDRELFGTQRQAWAEQHARQRQALDERRAAMEAELGDRRTRLDARQEWIERQKAGLDQVRDEALALHRQSLEMRLIAEQLWAQISGRLPPAEVTQAIAQMRLKLAEQYRIEEDQLAARRNELIELSQRIAAQHHELTTLRSGLRDWAAARQAEIEQQAATLVARQQAGVE
jgi:hypothetical protein